MNAPVPAGRPVVRATVRTIHPVETPAPVTSAISSAARDLILFRPLPLDAPGTGVTA
jgi:hypothetical protein